MGRKTTVIMNSFYCLNCGKKIMDLPRKKSNQHESLHRKKLYCPWCKQTLNAIEVRNEQERWDFLENFEQGAYENEKEASLNYVRASGIGEVNLGE